MPVDILTVDNLCDAIRHFLRRIAAESDCPVDQVNGLVLCGVPSDDEMRTLMELFGGTIKITVREQPPTLQEPVDHSPVFGRITWEPSKEAAPA